MHILSPHSLTKPISAIVVLTVAMLTASCRATGEREFRLVQVCVGNDNGIAELKTLLRSVAASERMTFVDGSARTTQDLSAIARRRGHPVSATPVLNIGVERPDSMGLTAGNLGLPQYQIALGFSKGGDPRAAQEFSDRVVAALGQHWRVEAVPAGRGALPISSCDDGTRAGVR